MAEIFFTGICIAAAAIMTVYHLTRRNKLGSIAGSALTGLTALCILSHFGERFGTDIPLNPFNIAGSSILGVPFLICEVILKIL